ncbi:hypothetical protein CPEBRM1_ABPJDJAI_01084 [Companilactobacillus paralimentarius]
MKNINFSKSEINLLNEIIDDYVYDHDSFDFPRASDGKYFSREYPDDADKSNLINGIYDKLDCRDNNHYKMN